jgi:hypothetical protein
MPKTKYIINSTNQSIDGDFTVTGTVKSNNTGKYRALLTQTGTISGTSIGDFDEGLIIGETYTITTYETADDFSNIADVQSGTINQTGCVFIATGQIPNVWNNGSQLDSEGELIVDVLENTLGYDIAWTQDPFGGSGYYIGFNGNTGPLFNAFPRDRTEINIQTKYPFDWGPGLIPFGIPGVSSIIEKDSVIFINMYDYDNASLVDNALYYTPVEVTINQGPLTPFVAYGVNVDSFPYGNISIDVYAGDNVVSTINGDSELVNNINELVTALNNDLDISYLGTFSVNTAVEDGIILTTTQRIKDQFSPNNTLTFEAFNENP